MGQLRGIRHRKLNRDTPYLCSFRCQKAIKIMENVFCCFLSSIIHQCTCRLEPAKWYSKWYLCGRRESIMAENTANGGYRDSCYPLRTHHLHVYRICIEAMCHGWWGRVCEQFLYDRIQSCNILAMGKEVWLSIWTLAGLEYKRHILTDNWGGKKYREQWKSEWLQMGHL